MNICPCCSNVLLRHICRNEIYWFCPGCWQSMPVLGEEHKYFASKWANVKSSAKTSNKAEIFGSFTSLKVTKVF